MEQINKKIRVAVLYGGRSVEHEVSVQSAKNIIQALDSNKYDIVHIKISKQGNWRKNLLKNVDVAFPILLGSFGEDGCMQGFLRMANIPFVGSGVLGSAIGMDKDVTKRLLREAGLPTVKFLVFRKNEKINFTTVKRNIGLPLFVKPANSGSSVGIAKVKTKKEFLRAVRIAFTYDTKILIEEYIPCKEIECSVLGNNDPMVSIPGEIVPTHEFYDYDAKYLDKNGALFKIPAQLSPLQQNKVQKLSIKIFKILCLEGMARIDFFLSYKGKLYINEVNTTPGFTDISMYPKLWVASGISYSKLLDKLITLAQEKYNEQKKLKRSFQM